ncbi:MAG: hypothetical protein ACRBN8_11690 [Nannocystales bacterium]
MRVYDGLQRFELYRCQRGRASQRDAGDTVPAQEFVRVLRHGPRDALERVVDFLVREFAWTPSDFDRHDDALLRLEELIDAEWVEVVAFRPSGSIAGDVPDEDDVQELSDLVEDEDDEVAAGAAVEPPMGIEPESEMEPPPGFEVEFAVEDPDIPAFDFEIG